MIGRTLGHYRIESQIGAGGMGVVYLAHDERLHRDVALKVLPADTLADETARRRFRHEAQALSKLNHPNIATVHDFDSQEGMDFLVMEHIPGMGLDERLAGGPLAEKEAVKLGVQLAHGLEAAHREGVVHRDLKPGNLRITPDGRLKILDFGLAKGLRQGEGTDLTSLTTVGEVVGTLAYMAPEQVRGERVDARTDLYAAGAVLYEMATGRRAFPQGSAPELMYTILNQEPEPPSTVRRGISAGLDALARKALAKDPELRYQPARELGVDLERVGGAGPAGRRRERRGRRWARVPVVVAGALAVLLGALALLDPGGVRERLLRGPQTGAIQSLAVLPLENLSGDPQQEYFADGMTEELITTLAKISALTVISRSSVMRFKGRHPPLVEIARQLQIGTVIEGSVLRSGSRVRISATLVQAATGKSLWAENYERDLSDVLTLQGEVARAIAKQIQVRLSPRDRVRLEATRRVDPRAHEAYLRGRYAWSLATK